MAIHRGPRALFYNFSVSQYVGFENDIRHGGAGSSVQQCQRAHAPVRKNYAHYLSPALPPTVVPLAPWPTDSPPILGGHRDFGDTQFRDRALALGAAQQ